MFGPARKPCPMCTSLLAAWDGKAPDIEQRVALAMIARSPIERLLGSQEGKRGWTQPEGLFGRRGRVQPRLCQRSARKRDDPASTVFTRRDGTIRHFWSAEMGVETADPGQDPRGAPDLMPMWTSSTPRPRAAAPTGTRSWNTAPDGAAPSIRRVMDGGAPGETRTPHARRRATDSSPLGLHSATGAKGRPSNPAPPHGPAPPRSPPGCWAACSAVSTSAVPNSTAGCSVSRPRQPVSWCWRGQRQPNRGTRS